MNQCVPSWDLDDNPLGLSASTYSNSVAPESLSFDEVAELTWENGQLAMHGLAPSRVGHKAAATTAVTSSPAWDKPRAGGTLESIVNQATGDVYPKSAVNGLAPWFDHRRAFVKPAAAGSMTLDALVPCNNLSIRTRDNQLENSTHVLDSAPGMGTCMVGSCSVSAAAAARVRSGKNNPTMSESATCGGDSRQLTLDSSEREFGGGGPTSTSLWSPENTSSGGDTKTSGDDSVFHRRSQREAAGEKGKKKGSGKNSNSAKSRAAAIHNQSERKRRDKINQRMKTLQKMVPNSSKIDKASMLDEVIEYLKQLQAQVHMMSRMNMPNMMLQQQLQMSMMAQAMGMGMGVMDINTIGRMAPPAAAPAAFMQMPSWDTQAAVQPVMPTDFLSAYMTSCQSQPMTIDAYSRMAAMYQQQFQHPNAGSGSKN